MRDKKDTDERLDDFSDYMRQRLSEHQMPIDADGWNVVEARMNRKPRSRGRWWASGLVAAAVLLLAIWLLPSPEEMPLEESIPLREKMAGETEEPTVRPVEPLLPEKPIQKGIARTKGQQARKSVDSVERQDIVDALEIADAPDHIYIAETEVVEEADSFEDTPADTSSVVNRRGDSTVPLPEDGWGYGRQTSKETIKERKTGKQGKWLLAAAFGSSGYVDRLMSLEGSMNNPGDSNQGDPSQDPKPGEDDKDKKGYGGDSGNRLPKTSLFRGSLSRSSSEADNFLNGDRSFESYPDVSYSLPISFGFTVRKDLNPYIGLESGLMYTYLSTTFKRRVTNQSEVKSSLHYLGIPLNLVVYLWRNERWNIYLSGGGMVEKGLQAVYSGYLVENNGTIRKSRKEGIDGLQWSINASIGASYRLYGDWSLYIEPRFSHYFDCGQPASVRTDKPLGFGLSAGIRYAF